MRRHFTLISILIVLILLLASCGNDTINERKISRDVDEWFSSNQSSRTVESVSITKRQTSKADRTAYITASFTFDDIDYLYYTDAILTYTLYDEGWFLSNIEFMHNTGSFAAKKAVTEEDVTRYFLESPYVQNVNYVRLLEEIIPNKQYQFEYSIDVVYGKGSYTEKGTIEALFGDSSPQWQYSKVYVGIGD